MRELQPLHQLLYDTMSEISERCYAAGWMQGNEYRLWSACADPTDPLHYGMGEITAHEVATLRGLSAEIGGWIHWCDDATHPQLHIDDWGPRFVPMLEWVGMYAVSLR